MNIEPNELAEEAAVAHVALAIVDLMARNKASQRQLANVLGVSEARVSQILGAEQNLTVKTIARIASGLGHRLEVKFVAEPEYAAQELVESQKTIDALGTLVTNAAFANAGLQNERDALQNKLEERTMKWEAALLSRDIAVDERNALQARLTDLAEAASAFEKASDLLARIPANGPFGDGGFGSQVEALRVELRAALSRAKGE